MKAITFHPFAQREIQQAVAHCDPGLAIGQILRYIDAIAPGKTLREVMDESDPALVALGEREKKKRVRDMSPAERSSLDF